MKALLIAALVAVLLPLTGCAKTAPDETAAAPVSTAVTVPAGLFVSTSPADPLPLIVAKTDAKPGDRLTFVARVGGRRQAFIENRAIFYVADPALESCDQLEGDTCKYPWDYCCEPRDSLRKNMATVQVVDADGQPLKVSIENEHGLAPLKTIVVVGLVSTVDDAGGIVVNAESIHVKEG